MSLDKIETFCKLKPFGERLFASAEVRVRKVSRVLKNARRRRKYGAVPML
mgnify:CR=1 FL=1